MFERRRRNWDLSGTKNRIQQQGTTYGINWGNDQTELASEGKTESDELEYGWEDEDEQCFRQSDEGGRQRLPGQPELVSSGRQDVRSAEFRITRSPFGRLQRQHDYYEQNKKLTIYIDKELLETIERLKKGRYIPSYSWLVSEAIRFYLQDTSPR
jgi:hypothetical protein